MIALTAAKASTPATISFGLCSNMRIARPRSSASIAATAARRGGGAACRRPRNLSRHFSSPDEVALTVRIATLASASRYCWPARDRRRLNASGNATVTVVPSLILLCTVDLAGMQGDQAFDDRQAKAGAFVPALIGLAGLEEGIADPLEIFGRDANAGIGDAKHQPRSLDRRRKPSPCRRAR